MTRCRVYYDRREGCWIEEWEDERDYRAGAIEEAYHGPFASFTELTVMVVVGGWIGMFVLAIVCMLITNALK